MKSVDCDEAREMISASLDGHLAGGDLPRLEAHLTTCSSCRGWQARLRDLTRRQRLQVAQPATAQPVQTEPIHAFRNRVVRIALAWTGVLLVAWHLPEMLAGGGGTDVHLARHQAGFAMALGVAFLFVAARPDRAYGVTPFAATFAIVLVVVAVLDIALGSSRLLRESRHLIEIAGLVFVLVLGWEMGPSRRGRGRGDADVPDGPRSAVLDGDLAVDDGAVGEAH